MEKQNKIQIQEIEKMKKQYQGEIKELIRKMENHMKLQADLFQYQKQNLEKSKKII